MKNSEKMENGWRKTNEEKDGKNNRDGRTLVQKRAFLSFIDTFNCFPEDFIIWKHSPRIHNSVPQRIHSTSNEGELAGKQCKWLIFLSFLESSARCLNFLWGGEDKRETGNFFPTQSLSILSPCYTFQGGQEQASSIKRKPYA